MSRDQLAEEAETDRQADQNAAGTPTVDKDRPLPTGTTALEGASLLNRIIREFGISAAYAQETRKDEIYVTLQPGEGAEVKLAMIKGAKASFTWTATDKGKLRPAR